MRLLAVEDDPVLADGLRVGLGACGWTVETVARVEDALAALESSTFDAVVLDLGLPDGDGLEILRFVRHRDMDVGVVILSARDDSRDRIAGLDTGADDYVGKPFDLDELAARLRAVRRRLLGRSQPALSHEGVTLDPKSRLAWRGQGDLHLSRREFAILEALMERPSHVLSRSQLEERLYGWQEDIGSNAVEVHIHHLRAKLGADFIRTVRGLGYTLQ
ncbi:response regulator transcription factor [Brevundimonas sp.]|uniref:response regulator transcription factor n=1 Tax=Brevundimonas sp. TaxID=1871086 RepID=UPI0028B1F192|nr:response regulator transcription factor [Brevundimonas sp.]